MRIIYFLNPVWSDFSAFNRKIRTSLTWIDYADISRLSRHGFPGQYRASTALKLSLYQTLDSSVLRVGGIRMESIIESFPLIEGIY